MAEKFDYELFLLCCERNRREEARKKKEISKMSDAEIDARIRELKEKRND